MTTSEVYYNDYKGYFEELVPEEAFSLPANFRLFKSMENIIDEIFTISNNQTVQQIRKDDLITEMAMTLEQIYINSGYHHLIKTIAASMCLILTKKDKITTPSHIYDVLNRKAKGKYANDYGNSKRTDIFAQRNVRYQELRNSLNNVIINLDTVLLLEKDKQEEIFELLNSMEDIKARSLTELESSLYKDPTDVYNEGSYSEDGLPQEREQHWGAYDEEDGTATTEEGGGRGETGLDLSGTDNDTQQSRTPQFFPSMYYNRLGQYIEVLQKLRQNVGKYPPSPELDAKLDQSLSLEIEIITPSIDMKFKRSLPQLDETISYADNQSLNGASSVMHETALVESDEGRIVDFSRSPYKRYKEIVHKLTPEQIDTRHGYISIIRKKMATWQPHLYYHILYYEGSPRYNHYISIGKMARSNLLRKKMNEGNGIGKTN